MALQGHRLLLAVAVVTGLLAVARPAHAGYDNRALRQKAVGSCQGALPTYDAMLRKKPTGIVNEGTRTAFVSCGVTTNVFGQTTQVDVQLSNLSGQPVTVTCTLMTGTLGVPTTSFTQSLYIPVTGSTGMITFSSLELNNDQPFDNEQAVSCKLPPQVELNSTGVVYTEWTN